MYLENVILFSTLDIASGYWNVHMAVHSIEKNSVDVQIWSLRVASHVIWVVQCSTSFLEDDVEHTSRLELADLSCLLGRLCSVQRRFPTHLIRLKQVLEWFRSTGFKLKMKRLTPSDILPNPEKSEGNDERNETPRHSYATSISGSS
ncbi:hypothetical protein PHPALM_27938 [Phytophthora palmivora]|uniref:Uncharacterized protein n=1 Tax=Phytophthora palmivora TaxID=4796 RepID=A0A2P4XBB9_9STRA|nr:hypothetical protein PHPALM_27938 [Phytophthora palmivora]